MLIFGPRCRNRPPTLRRMISGTPSPSTCYFQKSNTTLSDAQICRFSAANFPKILDVVSGLHKIGEKHNATAGQVTLAWILAQGPEFVVIPGTKKIKVGLFYLFHLFLLMRT
jgi:aryl-alcohol dehydrogenase-like predicted oxidoreductase